MTASPPPNSIYGSSKFHPEFFSISGINIVSTDGSPRKAKSIYTFWGKTYDHVINACSTCLRANIEIQTILTWTLQHCHAYLIYEHPGYWFLAGTVSSLLNIVTKLSHVIMIMQLEILFVIARFILLVIVLTAWNTTMGLKQCIACNMLVSHPII